MPKESKIFASHTLGTQDTISLYECFGWEMHSWNDKTVTMQREVKHPEYATFVAKQEEFEQLFSQYLHLREPVLPPPPKPMDKRLFVLGIICLIVPGVLYCVSKNKERKKYENEVVTAYHAEVAKYEETKRELLEETKHICEESRHLFFHS